MAFLDSIQHTFIIKQMNAHAIEMSVFFSFIVWNWMLATMCVCGNVCLSFHSIQKKLYTYEKRHKYTQKCVYSIRIGSNRMVNLVSEWCVFIGIFRRCIMEQRNDGMKGIYLERCSHLYIYYHQLQNNERRTSNANSDDAWCWIRANIEVKAIFVGIFSFYSHLTTPEQQWLCNPKSIGIWHTSMCDNKTHMTWIRFRHMPFNYGRFVICLHGLYSHFPNGVHISISRNSSKIFF